MGIGPHFSLSYNLHCVAYRCEPSWLLQRNTKPIHDDSARNCSTPMTTVSQCLDACLMTSPRCAGATTSPAPGDVIECRLYAHENQLRPTRDVTGTDLYVLHSHCYSHGEFSRAFFYMFYSVYLCSDLRYYGRPM